MTADNASSNAIQVAALYHLKNLFDKANRVRCFNHTIQLTGKVLIKSFNAGMGKAEDGENSISGASSLKVFNEDDNDNNNNNGDAGLSKDSEVEDDDDEILSKEEHSSLITNTLEARKMVFKVYLGFFSVLSNVTNLFLTASATLLCDYLFNYHCTSSVATILPGP